VQCATIQELRSNDVTIFAPKKEIVLQAIPKKTLKMKLFPIISPKNPTRINTGKSVDD
jgi:hypothetical protein